jgi:AcrR family transcriptional regulator
LPTSPSPHRRPTRWVGLAADDRRAERRTLLLDAAFELLGTEGWSGTSVRAVCHAARLNPRYFYESFEDLDALLVAVYDRLVEELSAGVVAAVEAAPVDDPKAQMRASLDAIVGFVDEDRRRGRVLYVEALGNESLNRRRMETAHSLVGFVEESGSQRLGVPPPGEQIGRITAAILVGGAGELVVSWLAGRIDLPREQLVDDATELLFAVGQAAADIATRRAKR